MRRVSNERAGRVENGHGSGRGGFSGEAVAVSALKCRHSRLCTT